MDPSGSYDNRGTGEPIHKENSNQYDVSEPLGKRADDDLHFATPIVVVESVSSLERSSIVDIDGTTDCGTLDGSVIGDRKAAECQPADPKYAQELSNLAKTNEQQTQDCPLDSFDGESDSGTANELTIIETVITETLPTKSAFTDFL